MMDKRLLVFGIVGLIAVIAASALVFLTEPDNSTYEQGVFDGCNLAWSIHTGQVNPLQCAQVVDRALIRDNLALPEY